MQLPVPGSRVKLFFLDLQVIQICLIKARMNMYEFYVLTQVKFVTHKWHCTPLHCANLLLINIINTF